MSKKTKSTKAKVARAKRETPSGKATAEEISKGVPENGFVVLFRVFTKKEHDELVSLKEKISKVLPEGTRPSWPAVIFKAMRDAA